jgi:hypothetical protein
VHELVALSNLAGAPIKDRGWRIENHLARNDPIFDHQFPSLIFDLLSSILDPQSSILHLRFLLFGLGLPLAGADLAPLPFAGAFPPGAAAGLPAGSLTSEGPVFRSRAFKLLESAGFAGIGTELTVGSSA